MREEDFPAREGDEPNNLETGAPTPEGFISLEELTAKIDAAKLDEASILDMITEAAGSIPVPDREDTEATIEYDRRQTEILNFARERLGRTILIRELVEWIEQRSK